MPRDDKRVFQRMCECHMCILCGGGTNRCEVPVWGNEQFCWACLNHPGCRALRRSIENLEKRYVEPRP